MSRFSITSATFIALLLSAFSFIQCNQPDSSSVLVDAVSSNPSSKTKTCQSILLPLNTTTYDSLVAELPSYPSKVFGGVLPEEPLHAEGNQALGLDGNFWPAKGEYFFTKGIYYTQIDSFQTRAYFRGWDFTYSDSAMTTRQGWAPCLTHGEVIFFKSMLNKPRDYYCPNRFELTDFGDSLYLVRLDSTKGHQLCFLPYGGGDYYAIASALGSKMEIQGLEFNRRADGWYCEDRKFE